MDPRAIVLGCVCVVGATAVMAIPRPSGREVRELIAQADAIRQVARPEAIGQSRAAASLEGDVALPSRPAPSIEAAAPAPSAAAKASAPAAKPVAPPALEPTPIPARFADHASELAASAPPEANNDNDASAVATIAGCLERDDETYWLKNTSGTEAPRSRSWKSGFLKKRSASIQMIDSGQRFRLASHIGQRVETRGILVDREMQVRSLRVLGSC